MEIVAQQSSDIANYSRDKSLTLAEKISNYCNSLEDSRVLLLAFTVIIQGCIFVPITMLIVSFFNIGLGGLSIGLLSACTVAVLVSNMAEASIKIILASFIASTLVTIALLAIHLV